MSVTLVGAPSAAGIAAALALFPANASAILATMVIPFAMFIAPGV